MLHHAHVYLHPGGAAKTVKYVLGRNGTNLCPSGTKKFNSLAACVAAYGTGKGASGSGNVETVPRGCYLTQNGRVGFNSHPIGKGFALIQPICDAAKGVAQNGR